MTRRAVTILGLALAASCAAASVRAASLSAEASDDRNELGSTATTLESVHIEQAYPQPAFHAVKKVAAPAQSGSANPLWEISLETLQATRDRPLFSGSRRPPPPPVVAAAPVVAPPPPPPPAEPEKPLFTLVGVVHGAEADVGLFLDQSGKILRLRIGQEQEGWVVRSVEVRKTVLQKDSQQVMLELPARNAEIGAPPHSALAAITQPSPDPVAAFKPGRVPGLQPPCDLDGSCPGRP